MVFYSTLYRTVYTTIILAYFVFSVFFNSATCRIIFVSYTPDFKVDVQTGISISNPKFRFASFPGENGKTLALDTY